MFDGRAILCTLFEPDVPAVCGRCNAIFRTMEQAARTSTWTRRRSPARCRVCQSSWLPGTPSSWTAGSQVSRCRSPLTDHPLKWPDLVLFGVVQSKDQMAASHLEGLLAGPVYAASCASARVAHKPLLTGAHAQQLHPSTCRTGRYVCSLSGSHSLCCPSSPLICVPC